MFPLKNYMAKMYFDPLKIQPNDKSVIPNNG